LINKKEFALAKINSLYNTPEGEFGPTLFVSYHLEEFESNDWLDNLKVSQPTAKQILESLVLIDEWSSNDDGINDTFDFSLPNNMTGYLLSVRFSSDEKIESVSMES